MGGGRFSLQLQLLVRALDSDCSSRTELPSSSPPPAPLSIGRWIDALLHSLLRRRYGHRLPLSAVDLDTGSDSDPPDPDCRVSG